MLPIVGMVLPYVAKTIISHIFDKVKEEVAKRNIHSELQEKMVKGLKDLLPDMIEDEVIEVMTKIYDALYPVLESQLVTQAPKIEENLVRMTEDIMKRTV